jgi:hypothetical protein
MLRYRKFYKIQNITPPSWGGGIFLYKLTNQLKGAITTTKACECCICLTTFITREDGSRSLGRRQSSRWEATQEGKLARRP